MNEVMVSYAFTLRHSALFLLPFTFYLLTFDFFLLPSALRSLLSALKFFVPSDKIKQNETLNYFSAIPFFFNARLGAANKTQ